MKTIKTACTATIALVLATLPVVAGAACLERGDMHALQAASLQQRLMVAAFTCHDASAYNRFVLAHRSELQKSDASLKAFFKRNSQGDAAYNTYKTHLANASALESSHSDDFCGSAGQLFDATSGGGSLDGMLDTLPTADTGYSACYMTSAQPMRGREQRMVHTASITPRAPAPDNRDTRRDTRRSYDRRDRGDDYDPYDRGRNYAWNERDNDGPYDRRDDERYRDRRDDRYADRRVWRDRDDDGPYYDGPYYDGPDDDGPYGDDW